MGCIGKNCKVKNLTYGFKGTKKGISCAKHKDEIKGLVDIKHPKCAKPDCKIRPYYNFEGEKVALYCKEHIKKDMVDVKNPKCVKPDCKEQPYYNFEGEKVALYCVGHKLKDMIDVKNKKCAKPVYNFEG